MKNISREDFYIQLNSCKYGKEYLELVTNPKNHLSNKEKGERHHIHPRCLGGNNDKNNIVKLSYFNHTLAHILLAKASIELNASFSYLLLIAITEFSRKQINELTDMQKITLEDIYNWSYLRELGYKSLGKLNSKRLNSMTKDDKKQIYNKVSNWYTDINNKKEHSVKTSEGTKIGKANMSDEARKNHSQNTSKSLSGKRLMIKAGKKKWVMKKDIQLYLNDGWIFSKKQKVKKTKEELKEIRKKAGKKSGNKLRGSRKMTNGIISKKVKYFEIQSYLDNGWKFTHIYTSDKERKGHSNVKLMNNGISATWININDIPYYELIGYKIGGIKKKKNKTSPVKGRIVIHCGDIEKRVKPEEKEYYELIGWTIGPSDKSRNNNRNSNKSREPKTKGKHKVWNDDTHTKYHYE